MGHSLQPHISTKNGILCESFDSKNYLWYILRGNVPHFITSQVYEIGQTLHSKYYLQYPFWRNVYILGHSAHMHMHTHIWPTSFRRNPLFLVSKNPSSPYDRSATAIWGRCVRSIPHGPDWPCLDSRSCSWKMIQLDILMWYLSAVTSCRLIYCINKALSVDTACAAE